MTVNRDNDSSRLFVIRNAPERLRGSARGDPVWAHVCFLIAVQTAISDYFVFVASPRFLHSAGLTVIPGLLHHGSASPPLYVEVWLRLAAPWARIYFGPSIIHPTITCLRDPSN